MGIQRGDKGVHGRQPCSRVVFGNTAEFADHTVARAETGGVTKPRCLPLRLRRQDQPGWLVSNAISQVAEGKFLGRVSGVPAEEPLDL